MDSLAALVDLQSMIVQLWINDEISGWLFFIHVVNLIGFIDNKNSPSPKICKRTLSYDMILWYDKMFSQFILIFALFIYVVVYSSSFWNYKKKMKSRSNSETILIKKLRIYLCKNIGYGKHVLH